MAIINGTPGSNSLSETIEDDSGFSFAENDWFDGLGSLLNRYQLMPQLLRGMVIDQAIADFSCTEAERKVAIEEFCRQQQLTSPEVQEAWLHNQGMTREQMAELAIRLVLLEKFKTATWGRKLESYFLTRKASFDWVVYSLIRTKDQGLAQELYFRVQEGEQSFADLARVYSQGPEAYTGGVIGPAPLSKPHPEIARILSISQPGQLWPPRCLEGWFFIIRLEKLFPAQLDEQMRRRLLDELFEAWLQEQMQQIGSLRSLWSSSSKADH